MTRTPRLAIVYKNLSHKMDCYYIAEAFELLHTGGPISIEQTAGLEFLYIDQRRSQAGSQPAFAAREEFIGAVKEVIKNVSWP